jgi:hypothetical protein
MLNLLIDSVIAIGGSGAVLMMHHVLKERRRL